MASDEDDEKRRRDDAEEERRHWEALEDEERAETERETERRDAAIETMETWFFEQFEDPQNETPRDGEDQAFIYVWGGPFEAPDVLHGQFGADFSESWINAAVERIERDGTTEWAPTASGDFYEHPDPEIEEETAPEDISAQLTRRILDRLDQLEEVVAALPGLPGNIGHNAPPSEIGLPPYPAEDAAEIATAIADTRAELGAAAPDPAKLATLSNRFERWGSKFGIWLAKKGDLATDELIKNSIKVLTWGTALSLFGEVAHELVALARHLLTFP
ncbi:MAG: hypothetical protein V4564_10045 [Pseudomonadota bacterium]